MTTPLPLAAYELLLKGCDTTEIARRRGLEKESEAYNALAHRDRWPKRARDEIKRKVQSK